ncbi:MAG: hypothetical protein J6P87_01605, partial [Lachnospiraceae bacterium]|nr:hypothetical protein [Lachnospiraceae bacterium]
MRKLNIRIFLTLFCLLTCCLGSIACSDNAQAASGVNVWLDEADGGGKASAADAAVREEENGSGFIP